MNISLALQALSGGYEVVHSSNVHRTYRQEGDNIIDNFNVILTLYEFTRYCAQDFYAEGWALDRAFQQQGREAFTATQLPLKLWQYNLVEDNAGHLKPLSLLVAAFNEEEA